MISTNVLPGDMRVIEGSFLFNNIDKKDLPDLLLLAKKKLLPKNQYLCSQWTASDRYFIIATGVGAVEKISNSGRRQILGFIFPGDFVGLSGDEYFEYGVRAISDSTAYEFNRDKLLKAAHHSLTLNTNLAHIRGMVLSNLFDQMYLLGQMRAYERVCFLLLQLLSRIDGATPEQLNLPMTRTDIADHLGLTIETVSRSFGRLRRENLIAILPNNGVSILDLDKMKRLASME
jgi:CRP/FNR family transcriptional regulator